MSNTVLHTLVSVRKRLLDPKHDHGQISGTYKVSDTTIGDLVKLADEMIIEDVLIHNGQSNAISKIQLKSGESFNTPIVLYTKNLNKANYYESLNDFISDNTYEFPDTDFYIHDPACFSSDSDLPGEVLKFKDVQRLMEILSAIADYVQDEPGEAKNLIFFDKKKLSLLLTFNRNHCRTISFLGQLHEQFNEEHDKDQRVTIFKSELISNLIEYKEEERFGKLLTILDDIYDSYLKSHLLYIQKFSYHDLKSEVDEDKLEYTKKIYGTVNDVQAKLIAVPAAFLLVLSQFDFTGVSFNKNLLITVGSVLFSILLEILLSNQFGLLRYIEREIIHFKSELKNKENDN